MSAIPVYANPDDLRPEDSDYVDPLESPRFQLPEGPQDIVVGAKQYPNPHKIEPKLDTEGAADRPVGASMRLASNAIPTSNFVMQDAGAPPAPDVSGLPTVSKQPNAIPLQVPTMGAQTQQAEAPHRFSIAGLWSDADKIHNPYLRVLGKIGAGLARAADIGTSIVAPGVDAAIPGTTLNTRLEDARAAKQKTQDIENRFRTAQAANEESKPELAQAKQELAEQKQNEVAEKNKNEQTARLRKLGLKTDEAGQIVPVSYEEMSPTEQAVHDLKINQAEAADAKAQLDRMKGDPNSPMYQVQVQRLRIAQQNASNAARRLNLSEAQFGNKLQEQEYIKPSGQAQSRGSAADAALAVIPELQQMLHDPEYRSQLGPVMGRIKKGELALGDVDPKIARLYSSLQSFYALQPAVHGFRNAGFVKDFDSFIGGLSRNPDDILAGIDGLVSTLKSVSKEGTTYKKRIVEGRQSDLGAAPSGAAEGKTGTLKDGTKVVVRKGRLVKVE